MKRKREILTAVLLSSSLGLGAQSIWAQGAPGGGQTGPMPGQSGTIPEKVQRPDVGNQGMAGVTADDIKKAKEALKAKGLNPGPMDGVLDGKTQQALRDFQKANKLPVTGNLDPQTAEKLGMTLNEKGSIPQRGPSSSMPKDSDTPRGKGGM
jgi:peptidoglycan hydrolase-like protein with peptidoglycan-binding domain